MPTKVSSYVRYEPATSGRSAKTTTATSTAAAEPLLRTRSDTAHDRLPEEARRTDDEHEQEDPERDRQQELGRDEGDVAAEQVERHPEQEPADDGAERALDPAQHRGDERVEEDALHDVRREEVHWRDEQ